MDEHGVTPKFELTSAQRHAIYQDLHKERSKLAPSLFAARVGADVPPIIELHALPDHVLASNPETKLYIYICSPKWMIRSCWSAPFSAHCNAEYGAQHEQDSEAWREAGREFDETNTTEC